MNTHIKDETLISFLYGECSADEHETIQAHIDQCAACQILCSDLHSISTIAQKAQAPSLSENVVQSIQMYAETQLSMQQNILNNISRLFCTLFPHKWLYASSLAVVIITCILILKPGKQNELMLDDAQFDAAITLLNDEIDEYISEYKENYDIFLDDNIADLEMRINAFSKEVNHLF